MAQGLPTELREALTSNVHTFLKPTPALHSTFLQLAKHYLDPVAADVTETQLQRQRESRQSRKRKRGRRDSENEPEELLRMRKVHVEGFSVEQIWQQARRVLEAAAEEIQRATPRDAAAGDSDDEDLKNEGHGNRVVRFEGDSSELGSSQEDSDQDEVLMEDEMSLAEEGQGEAGSDGALEEASSDEQSPDIGAETELTDLTESEEQGVENLVKDKHGLNDGFFSIDRFNRDTQFLERQDARGDPDDGAASDEEDIDWGADPMATDPRSSGNRLGQAKNQMRNDESDDEDGPTFGNADLHAPEGESDEELGDDSAMVDGLPGMGDFSNANDIFYKDFFAPPAKSSSTRSRKGRTAAAPNERHARGGLAKEEEHEEDEEMQRAMSAVQRDLFDDDVSDNDEPDEYDVPGEQIRSNLSTHEKRQLALRAEIRRLEAENVAAKPWSLTGETVAPARPLNSLLEEDLDFERAGKPVPVVTEEDSESIEALIKRRIIAREFDELVRRRPDDLVNGPSADPRRGRVAEELSDSKPAQSLAEEYEQDHLRRSDPNFVDKRSEALKKAHAQIEAHWASVSALLDALTNWHYKPRPPAPSLDVRVDAPAVSMEDARPSAGGDVGGASRLAPQELYRAGGDGDRAGEVVTKGGTAVAHEEESRDARRRRRRRAKERAKKAAGNNSNTSTSTSTSTSKPAINGTAAAAKSGGVGLQQRGRGAATANDVVMGQLRDAGVKVIDKAGRLRDVDGNQAPSRPGDSAARGVGALKL